MRTFAAILLGALIGIAHAATKDAPLQLEPGARVGVMNLLAKDLTHYHWGFTGFTTIFATYPVGWPIRERVETSVVDGVEGLGYAAIPVAVDPAVNEDRVKIFSGLALTTAGMTRASKEHYQRAASEGRLDALIVLAPHSNTSVRSAGSMWTAKRWQFPDYIQDWGVISTGKPGGVRPAVINMSNFMVIDVRSGEPKLAGQVFGDNDTIDWDDAGWPEDVKELPLEAFNGARPILEGMFDRQVAATLGYLAPAATP